MARLPPGPRSVALHTLRYMLDPYAVYARAIHRYGDPFTAPGLLGPTVVTGCPEGVREIFTADPDTFTTFAPELTAPLLGDTSVVLSSGARHRRVRKLLMPPFHGKRIQLYGALIADITRREAAKWRSAVPFTMEQSAQAISLEVVLRAVFGLEHPAHVAEFTGAIAATVKAMNPLILFFEPLRRDFAGMGPWARFQKISQHLDDMIYREIAARQASSEERTDILSLLMSARDEDGQPMTAKELRDELLTLLVAGHETVATAISWAMHWVHHLPPVRARLLDEIDALGADPDPDAIAQLPYLHAVCSESLRLYPIAAEVNRVLTQPFDLMGYRLPAGVAVSAAVGVVHMRPDLYPEPEQFRPERFLERSYSPYELIPFGGGNRRCIGAAFAMHEIKIVLATLLARLELAVVASAPAHPVRRGMTMGPSGGVRMVLKGARRPQKISREIRQTDQPAAM